MLAFKKILFQIFAKAFEDLIVMVYFMQYAKKENISSSFCKEKNALGVI